MADIQSSPNVSRLTTFFKGSDTQFGIFYPKNYIVAIFRDYAAASHAESTLRRGGMKEEDVIAVPGEDVVEWAKDNLVKSGLWSVLMRELSRLFATEEIYHESDLEQAKQGAGFVAAYCPTEKSRRDVWQLIRNASPIAVRHYGLGGIEHLYGENLP